MMLAADRKGHAFLIQHLESVLNEDLVKRGIKTQPLVSDEKSIGADAVSKQTFSSLPQYESKRCEFYICIYI